MRQLVRNLTLCILILVFCVWEIYPPSKQLRLGRDLGGGTSLVYTVQLGPDDKDVIPKMIEVLKDRIDPKGLSEIQFIQRGRDRIEITMPAPTSAVQELKKKLEAELSKLSSNEIDPAQLERVMRSEGAERDTGITQLAGSDKSRLDQLKAAAAAFDAAKAARTIFEAAQAELKAAKDANEQKAVLDDLQKRVDDLVAKAADAEEKYEQARDSARGSALTAQEMRRALALSNAVRTLRNDNTGQLERLPSPRETTIKKLKEQHPQAVAQIDVIEKAFDAYVKERRGLDDPSDLKRLVSSAGVLTFRITVAPGADPSEEDRLRRELRERGPKGVRATDARWYKINRIESWYDSAQELAVLSQSPSEFFRMRGCVAEQYEGEYFILCYDVPGSRLTRGEGDWGVRAAFIGPDQRGLPAIKFQMNAQGGSKLGELTGKHVGQQMAVLLDDEVYTAPRLQSKISSDGEITGSFSDTELNYVTRVLSAGSLQAKLSPEPISESTLGPELGKDNLDRGLRTAVIAFVATSAFMIFYYFQCGLIAVFALWCNLLIILGIMALNRAAFTLPGIAGVILSFSQAVDANVLIYERMREEFRLGHDMRTSVRLGFSRAFSSIVDGNVSHLIVCVVLGAVGTQEIKGFAITLGIGVLATLFSALMVSRVIFTIFVDHIGWRKTSMLPMVIPALQRALTPNIDWIKPRWFFVGLSSILVTVGLGMAIVRSDKMLSKAFTGGAVVEVTFKKDASGNSLTRTRADMEKLIHDLGHGHNRGDPLFPFSEAEVLPVNPQDDGVTSSRFKIEVPTTDEKLMLSTLSTALTDLVEVRPALEFSQRGETDWKKAPIHKIFSKKLGDNIELRLPSTGVKVSDVVDNVERYVGGLAIVLEGIQPAVPKAQIVARLDQIRQQSDYTDTLGRAHELIVIEGTDEGVKTAVFVVRDDSLNSYDNEAKWGDEVAAREWKMVVESLSRPSQLASVDTFSPAIAATFKAQAVVAVGLAMLLLTIYIWVRFGAARWALAATLPLFHDVLSVIGFVAIAQVLYEHPSTSALAAKLGLLPFKIDLNMVAAILALAGYSLNDTIIILDRIRENKGKLAYASRHAINDSINHTISRTLITSGTTLLSTTILYIFGGEAVRGFAYAFTLGIAIGTYSSIAVSAPLVWSRKSDRAELEKEKRALAAPITNGQATGTSIPPVRPTDTQGRSSA